MQILQLVQATESWMYTHGFKESTVILAYEPHWNKLRQAFGDDAEFSECDVSQFAEATYGTDIFSLAPYELSKTASNARRALDALTEFYSYQAISGHSRSGALTGTELTDKSRHILDEYKEALAICGDADITVRNNSKIIHRFLALHPIESVTKQVVLDYISSFGKYSRMTSEEYRRALHRFFAFCYDNGYLSSDTVRCLLPYKRRSGTEIATVYAPEELSVLLKYVKTHGKTPLRNYAIILLTAVFGFRAKDISDLTLHAIDWEKGTIRIIQSKTQETLEHSLTDLTADALAGYLLDERPETDNSHVFLKQDGTRLSPAAISSMAAYGFSRCGIIINGRKHGSHSIRHSLASNMLAGDSDILTISKVLGHSSVSTTKAYAKVDIAHLRLVELEVPAYE